MPVESAADRLAYFSTDEFGETATYTTAASASASIDGIFNDPHLPVVMGDRGAETSDHEPTFLCRETDLPSGAAGGDAGDTLALVANDVHGVMTFRVLDLRHDGTGMTLLTLGAN